MDRVVRDFVSHVISDHMDVKIMTTDGIQILDDLWYSVCTESVPKTVICLQSLTPSDENVLRSEDKYEILGSVSVVMLKTVIKE